MPRLITIALMPAYAFAPIRRRQKQPELAFPVEFPKDLCRSAAGKYECGFGCELFASEPAFDRYVWLPSVLLASEVPPAIAINSGVPPASPELTCTSAFPTVRAADN